ncbi:chemotaxis protein CheW [Enterococcus alcedinis]|uniref:Chemotaxis protein CheA n=1 Tax=Enterococcus alcedinis TaxID=1274384 RepID=A0A917JG81_9ENTE|nr:chemotaxis protein CheA [Enterococcus alcedinis]MBP2102615.1 two-component system chemotaxis sensor kinase CheA [Enterococcus alcedinis]GGI66174.1 chemotaxis protein CheA [Enterococcus alcedinis]
MDDNNIYRTLFFEESDDHLQQLNDNVLALENDPSNLDLLNEIFRSAHTLKGMAATMGYDVMTELTHKMENILEEFKSGAIQITSDYVSLIFSCLDRLSTLVEDLREDKELRREQIADLLAELETVEGQTAATTQETVADEESRTSEELNNTFESLEESDLFVIEQAIEGAHNAYSIGIRLDADSMLKGPRVFLIMEKLEQEGDILHTEPAAEILEEGAFETDFHLIYLTKNAIEDVQANIESNSEIDRILVEPFDQTKHLKKVQTLEEIAVEALVAETNEKVTKTPQYSNNQNNQSIRVDLSRLDLFLNLVSELVVYRNQLEDVSNRENINEIKDSLEQVSRLTSELQDLVLKIRMQQVNVVFSRFPRMVRDLSNELGKEIDLIITGEETELDKTVVSELSDPLVHLLRNSIDHGIEQPANRIKIGKEAKGTIRLTAFQEGNQVIITIEDDGKGLNPEILKASAEKKGISTSHLSDEEIQRLIFHPGFSTAKEVTNVSGRGVGMDAVQSKILSLGGTIELKSTVDVGTIFTIRLPLTLSIIDALMVQVADDTFAVPLDVVERVVRIKEEEIVKTLNQEVYEFQGNMIPVLRTNEMLAINDKNMDKYYGIIVNIDQKDYAILADHLIGQQEVVIKKIDSMLQQTRKYQGATILGDGSIALILDVNAICSDQRSL